MKKKHQLENQYFSFLNKALIKINKKTRILMTNLIHKEEFVCLKGGKFVSQDK